MKKSLFYRMFHDEYKDYRFRDFFSEMRADDVARYCESTLMIFTGLLLSRSNDINLSFPAVILGETGAWFAYVSGWRILKRLKE